MPPPDPMGEINIGPPDKYVIFTEYGEAIVCVHDSNPWVIYNDKRDRNRKMSWQWTLGPNRDGKEVTKEEFETYAEICDIPVVEVTNFIEWEKTGRVNSNRECEDESSYDTKRETRKGLSGLYQRWRMLWLQVWLRPHRA